MAFESFVQAAIPRFDGHYNHWSMLMENFLRSKEFWPVVTIGVQEPATGTTLSEAQNAELDSLRLKDLKEKNYLFQAIDRSILETIMCKDTSKQIWDSMKKLYQGTTKAKQVHSPWTLSIANKMRIHGERLEYVTIVEKILCSMTEKFNYIGSLLVHEQKINLQDKEEVALKAVSSSKGTD
ncbi:hypothetical protein KY290_000981 [Solanum tuberosum]|uniref:Retrovirus-related Pol polyprotein from transposon TNT 1-94 n=1 Tax=Solanum tuberosum TaxID=4113 RepID=A0ABQ7WL04_SOLTU|nr:hypothetical protein KY290_000981 [Solanum tuberosum]